MDTKDAEWNKGIRFHRPYYVFISFGILGVHVTLIRNTVLTVIDKLFYLRTFQQLLHQKGGWLNGNTHFLNLNGVWQMNDDRLWIWPCRSQKIWLSKSKLIQILSNFFSLKNIKAGAQPKYINDIFVIFEALFFRPAFFTKIGSKFQTLIPNRALICKRPFKVRKGLFPFN